MRASDIVRHLCAAVERTIDARRTRAVGALVDALVRVRRLSLTALGRELDSATTAKHRIKRVDRLLGNSSMQAEIPSWYGALARKLLGRNARPIVLLDWTQVVDDTWALVAGVAFEGRAIPIYAEVHPEKLLSNRLVQFRFLDRLAEVMGRAVTPVLVADAGFKTPFFDELIRRGWNFVIRLRGACKLKRLYPNHYLSFDDAFARATSQTQDLGMWIPYASGWSPRRIVLAARPSKAMRQRHAAGAYARSACEPWLLVTSLHREPARGIVELYAKRMQIEETFRDTKNTRYGWALELTGTKSPQRQAVLLLLGCLALAAVLLAGAAAEAQQLARHFQANSTKSRRVLSLALLGSLVINSSRLVGSPRSVSQFRRLLQRYVHRPIQLCLPLTTPSRGGWR